MIVAHPDDEMLWGGAHLLNGNYLVVCITCGRSKTRDKEFKEVGEYTATASFKYSESSCRRGRHSGGRLFPQGPQGLS